ncbi:hypothetical protein WJX84_004650 [Apatococcus fuscideae]|uniref:Uncharacterized protein n=1 Tax=Apatococcus fuscideae TaxID=2026836 RepID=A0AAW1T9E0_9CHLO
MDPEISRRGSSGRGSRAAQRACQLCTICLIALIFLSFTASKSRKITAPRAKPDRLGQPQSEGVGKDVGLAALTGGISKVIHQSWRSQDVPIRFRPWSTSWRDNHPSWKWYLWTDEDNRDLIIRTRPSFLSTYDAFPQQIMRADAARILYMHTYGGCYVDLDFESLKPLDGLVSELPLALGSMGYEQSDHNVPNAFMCSSPGHQFWELCLETIEDTWLQSQQPGNPLNATQSDGIEQVTGPRMINVALKQWARGHSPVPLIEARHVYPYSWLMPVIEPRKAQRFEACQYLWGPFNAATCKSYFPEAYAVTYWTHTWEHVG